jgi:hypothetical protein
VGAEQWNSEAEHPTRVTIWANVGHTHHSNAREIFISSSERIDMAWFLTKRKQSRHQQVSVVLI